ncbi:RNA polymerase sigma factor [Sorangium sp. So ce321]|uniref:RNA polymerase sigma factor n=1 Tax=Sorangium sp. So ce321 TaxID=3133300 RepID=UPI003F5F3319
MRFFDTSGRRRRTGVGWVPQRGVPHLRRGGRYSRAGSSYWSAVLLSAALSNPALAAFADGMDADERLERSAASAAMDRYADGDAAAFPVVYDALAGRLLRYLSRLERDPTAAEDLLQQTFLRMHRARASFRRGSDVEPWAFSIARRLFLDARKRDRRRPLSWLVPEPDLEADAEAILMARQLGETMDATLASLPPLQREAFLLIREDGLTGAEAAATLGVSLAAVKLRAQRAYDQLRVALREDKPEGGR